MSGCLLRAKIQKAQYCGEKMKLNGNPLAFTKNQSKWRDLYGLYKKGNKNMFYRDMGTLIEKGIIVCLESGATTRTKKSETLLLATRLLIELFTMPTR